MEGDISNYLRRFILNLIEPKKSIIQGLESDSEEEEQGQLSTIIKEKDEKIAELERQLKEARTIKSSPQLSMETMSDISLNTVSSSRPRRLSTSITKKSRNPLPPLPPSPYNSRSRRRKSATVNKAPDILDDILFSEDTKDNWQSFYSSLKDNPNMISQYLEPSTTTHQRSTQSSRSRSKFKRSRSRPASTSIKRHLVTANRDWANFQVESENDPLSIFAINNYIENDKHGTLPKESYPSLYKSLKNALDVLTKQLELPKKWINVPVYSERNVNRMLKICKKFLNSREITVKVLKLIRNREEALDELMTASPRSLNAVHSKVYEISDGIINAVSEWKKSGLPFSSFIYQGNDIVTKIKDDQSRMEALFAII